jgi:hypothetical protein
MYESNQPTKHYNRVFLKIFLFKVDAWQRIVRSNLFFAYWQVNASAFHLSG